MPPSSASASASASFVQQHGPMDYSAPFGAASSSSSASSSSQHLTWSRSKSNAVRNTKYTYLTFVPLNLAEQFRRFMNRYFLLIATMQLWPAIAPVNPWSTWGPLIVIVVISAARELNDDVKRGKADDAYNARAVRLAEPGEGGAKQATSRQVRPGDVLILRDGDECPCDAVVLASHLPANAVLIETSALDGEADVKRRVSPVPDAAFAPGCEVPAASGEVVFPPPDGDVRTFRGVVRLESGETFAFHEAHAILKGCTVVQCGPPAMRSRAWCAVVAVYTGQETKVAVASSAAAAAPPKRSALDARVDAALAAVFAVQMLAVTYCGIVRGNTWREQVAPAHWYLAEQHQPDVWYLPLLIPLRFELLCSVMIPISLKVTLDIAKSYYARLIDWDLKMADGPKRIAARANATEIVEDLGCITHLLCDKTGTLTENRLRLVSYGVMVPVGSGIGEGVGRYVYQVPAARRMSGSSEASASGDGGSLASSATTSRPLRQRRHQIPAGAAVAADEELALLSSTPGGRTTAEEYSASAGYGNIVDDETHVAERRGMLTAALLCTSVTAVPPAPDRPAALSGASPDELAIVQGAARTGYVRMQRREDVTGSCTLDLGAGGGGLQTYEILDVLEFTSERRRMSVVVRGQLPTGGVAGGGQMSGWRGRGAPSSDSDRLFLVCKGSVDVVFSERRVAPTSTTAAEQGHQAAEFLSLKGLRALGIAWRELSAEEYASWSAAAKKARESLHRRDEHVAAAYDQIEKVLHPLGVVGIEDELQHGVLDTVTRLKRAGIAVWMLTGDQRATAMHVAYRAGLAHQQPRGGIVELSGGDAAAIAESLREASTRVRDPLLAGVDHIVVLHGDTLNGCLSAEDGENALTASRGELSTNEELLLGIVASVSGVVCYRCTPQQKARLCRFAKRVAAIASPGSRVAAIGDGGNDVSMIRAAHVGVGVAGREGSAACLASDYAIERFRHLQRLVLVHGRYAHKRTALVTAYSIYKSVLLSLCQLLHNAFSSAFSGASLFPASSLMLYNALYTNAAALFLVLDKDIDEEELLARPECYHAARLLQPMLLPNSHAVQTGSSAIWSGGDVLGVSPGGTSAACSPAPESSSSSPNGALSSSSSLTSGRAALGAVHLASWLGKAAWDASLSYAVFASSLGVDSSFSGVLRGGGDTAVEANGVFSACLWAAALTATLSASRLTTWQLAGTWLPMLVFYPFTYLISDVRNRGDDGGSALSTFLHPAYALSLLLVVSLVLLPYLLSPMLAVRRSWLQLLHALQVGGGSSRY